MKYACLVYCDESILGSVKDAECLAFSDVLRSKGQRLGGEALHPIATATTVRVRDGKVSITDGPFAETKEQLAGFYLIDAADLDDAIRIAADIPPARVGSIEVRPVRELVP
ncbi:MAG TPA: YciI family protein [Rhodothermales bacterium]